MDNKIKRPIGGNIFLILVTCVILVLIPLQIDGRQVADSLGARAFPYIAAFLVLIPNLLQMIKKIVENRKIVQAASDEESVASSVPFLDTLKNYVQKYWALTAVMALAFLATFIIDYIGYVITYGLLTCLMLLIFREKRWYFYVISVALVILIFLFFTRFLYVPLPSPF